MTSIEHQIKRASSQADILNCCGKFNNLVGFYVFYREQSNNKTIFEIHEHAIILSISNVLLHFSSEGSVRQRAIREQIINIFHISPEENIIIRLNQWIQQIINISFIISLIKMVDLLILIS